MAGFDLCAGGLVSWWRSREACLAGIEAVGGFKTYRYSSVTSQQNDGSNVVQRLGGSGERTGIVMIRHLGWFVMLAVCLLSLSACVIVPAPVYGRTWVPAHYNGWHWVPGHWV
jgi:hypothetical protein